MTLVTRKEMAMLKFNLNNINHELENALAVKDRILHNRNIDSSRPAEYARVEKLNVIIERSVKAIRKIKARRALYGKEVA